jgi:tetratricopeptide (TPR) repeat protein
METKMKASLNIIVKDEVDQIVQLHKQAKGYFHGIFITVSDLKAYNEIKMLENDYTFVDYRKWNDRFDDARNHNWDLAKDYDASMWIDADDEFDFSKVPLLIEQLNEYDAVFLPYHYDFDENGNLIVSHWRERLVRRDKPFYWKGWVHENLICEEYFTQVKLDIPVVHRQVEGHKDNSAQRNHEILLKAAEETKDPRYIHYLGISLFTIGEYREAINVLKEYISVGGWDEEIYRSLIKMAEASHMLGEYEESMQYGLRAVGLIPHYPMAYEILAHFEFQAKSYKEALEWVKMAVKKPVPENASIYDPASRDRTILTGALCEYQLGNFRDAAELIKQVETIDTSDIRGEFEYEASIERLNAILPALFKHYKDPVTLWSGLHEDIKYRPEFRKIRERYTEPKTWEKGSIVFFCGKGYEEWGPQTLDQGMGGSEEAIVYLSRALAKQGHDVTVYGELAEPIEDQGVTWLPWSQVDKRDQFDTLIVWRAPEFATQFKANKMFVDMHDLLPVESVKPHKGVTYLFKSQWHKDKYPKITDYKIIPNGIEVDQFKPVKKKKHSVIYPSAYYRGLEALLGMWPKVREQVPDATLDIYYGWNSWVGLEGEDDFYHRMVAKFEKMKLMGVKEHGRVDHKTLAKKMGESKVWAYPTEFPEIFCITAVKANLAGCKPVITDVAALSETGGPSASFVETDNIYSDEYSREKFVKEIVKALKEDHDPKEQTEWAKKFDWSEVAKSWMEAINEQ